MIYVASYKVVYQNIHARVPRNTEKYVHLRRFMLCVTNIYTYIYIYLGAVHNCQHLCIRTERTEGEGARGQRTNF